MKTRFQDRTEAGRLLAGKLSHYARRPGTLVLALPRGGVPVAYEVAQRLNAPLDVFVVRKLGAPGNEELAMGAIASGGGRVLNEQVIAGLGVTEREIEDATMRERRELARRERLYRGDRPPPEAEGRVVILVDDGVATGSTMRAAIATLRAQNPQRIVVAAPTMAAGTYVRLQAEADEVVAMMTPECFYGVGEWYVDFSQTSDEEVRTLLRRPARGPRPESLLPA